MWDRERSFFHAKKWHRELGIVEPESEQGKRGTKTMQHKMQKERGTFKIRNTSQTLSTIR